MFRCFKILDSIMLSVYRMFYSEKHKNIYCITFFYVYRQSVVDMRMLKLERRFRRFKLFLIDLHRTRHIERFESIMIKKKQQQITKDRRGTEQKNNQILNNVGRRWKLSLVSSQIYKPGQPMCDLRSKQSLLLLYQTKCYLSELWYCHEVHNFFLFFAMWFILNVSENSNSPIQLNSRFYS